tara:strand:- start:448 stop:657 length:210 start_codon:yes stop_codon:yes gene_type:complete
MSKSLCKGKRTSQPNLCKKVRGCKVANGTKRTFCRKIHNKNNKTKKTRKTPSKKTLIKRKLSRALKILK